MIVIYTCWCWRILQFWVSSAQAKRDLFLLCMWSLHRSEESGVTKNSIHLSMPFTLQKSVKFLQAFQKPHSIGGFSIFFIKKKVIFQEQAFKSTEDETPVQVQYMWKIDEFCLQCVNAAIVTNFISKFSRDVVSWPMTFALGRLGVLVEVGGM